MARTILLVGAAVWLASGIAGLAVAAVGGTWLLDVLPPLAIGAGALGGAVSAVSIGLLLLAVAHAVTLIGLHRRTGWGHSAAILLAGLLAAALLALAASALTAAADQPSSAAALIASALVAVAGTGAYGVAAVLFVGELRARQGS